MYLWRRLASQKWRSDNENELRAIAGNRLAIIEEAGRKRLRFEVASRFRSELQNLTKQFGGRVEKLPRDWLNRFLQKQKTKPLKIGKRLVVVRSPKDQSLTKRLIIPAGTAFGTGEHATTAMSLRLLERLTRNWKPAWSIVDLGTGTGILALAAKCFGANRVIGIDNDPVAIATAKGNARLNKIPAVQFRVGDVCDLKFLRGNRLNYRGYWGQVDIVTANLFSELLIEILPKLKAARWMILSGILRSQERDVTRALKRHKIDVAQVRRHGKWVAILTAVR
jgi:ribosomal protein L11 methyltransferase